MDKRELQKVVELLNGRPRPVTMFELNQINEAKVNGWVIKVRSGGNELHPSFKWIQRP